MYVRAYLQFGADCRNTQPKWGFLPSRDHLSPETADVKSAYCRTCMHRALKRAPRTTTAKRVGAGPALAVDREEFCPLDLYSRDPARTSRALQQLYASWTSSDGGINNLRFFLDGKLVKPSEVRAGRSALLRLSAIHTDAASRAASSSI